MRDVCRNFQRGSCQYGERCKFLHAVQTQRKPNHSYQHQNTNNPFGFGSKSASASASQQRTNPFGFGSQNSSYSNAPSHSDFKPNQFKPFENKWSRSSSQPQTGASRQSDNNSQSVNHKCTDPEICKRQIAEDFENEKPLWILTCYTHSRGAPCDIVGDISYEELRAAAYEDAKKGMSLQSIVEKERNILKSKLIEFEKLRSEPYNIPLDLSLDIQNHQSNVAHANPFSPTTQNSGPLSVSSFSQLGASLNAGFERTSAPQMNTLAQPNSFGSGGNFLTSNTPNLFGSSISGVQSSPFSAPAQVTMFPGSMSQPQQSPVAFNGSSSTTMFQTTSDVQLNKSQVENVSGDNSIWLKEKWNPGEIPEEAPPDAFVR
ncbi:zinc finger CCCH domain-containing protein 16 isoform X1 [Lotus japonicus]|uniref:zinc finger CCCH domain-containing protein 16 isoform X1 n=1 Tax=Lotus japonicus TaxID=34305 RepID=UPI00258D806C|nr:zinc finger CCCH domain-containing protein 16 isoform X1 [Lotus japonicus]